MTKRVIAPVAGIDRWRGGWIIAVLSDTQLELWPSDEIAAATDALAECSAVAINMPIALAEHGRREAESLVRAVLGSSARSVFTSPTRKAAQALTQAEATETNRAHGGPGISAQAFGLFASIRELRTALAGPAFDHWWETHPETAFAAMNDGQPLASKRSALGVAQRLDQLRRHLGPLSPNLDEVLLRSPAGVPIDDVLDALAAAWSARRIASGQATTYGEAGRDDEGFALGIRI